MKRRELIALLGGAAAWPLTARAQEPGRLWRIGVLSLGQDESATRPFLQGLQALGYVEGKTVAIIYRFAEGKAELLPDLAAELVRLGPDLIFSVGGEVAP